MARDTEHWAAGMAQGGKGSTASPDYVSPIFAFRAVRGENRFNQVTPKVVLFILKVGAHTPNKYL